MEGRVWVGKGGKKVDGKVKEEVKKEGEVKRC